MFVSRNFKPDCVNIATLGLRRGRIDELRVEPAP